MWRLSRLIRNPLRHPELTPKALGFINDASDAEDSGVAEHKQERRCKHRPFCGVRLERHGGRRCDRPLLCVIDHIESDGIHARARTSRKQKRQRRGLVQTLNGNINLRANSKKAENDELSIQLGPNKVADNAAFYFEGQDLLSGSFNGLPRNCRNSA